MKNLVTQRKEQKRNQILGLIRHSRQPLSRFDIKKLTTYSMTTVINTIQELIQQDLLIEDACSENNRMGRKPVFLHLNPSGGYFIGIEFNIQKMHCVILDFAGNVIFSEFSDTSSFTLTREFIDQIELHIEHCFSHLHTSGEKVLGIGIGLPGYIDMEKGIAIHYAYIKDWLNVPIIKILEKKFSIPCFIGNNISSMCLAFKWFGQYRQADDFVFVSVRTGARSIFFVNGEPYLGKNCSSGEIGHIKLTGCHKLCDCGQAGCLNTEVSDVAIYNKILEKMEAGRFSHISFSKDKKDSSLAVELLIQEALDGNQDAVSLIHETAALLGQALAQVVNLIAPPDIIISNKLCKAGDLFLSPLKESLKKYSIEENFNNVCLIPSPYGDNIGAIGAAALSLEENYNIFPMEF